MLFSVAYCACHQVGLTCYVSSSYTRRKAWETGSLGEVNQYTRMLVGSSGILSLQLLYPFFGYHGQIGASQRQVLCANGWNALLTVIIA